MFTFTPYYAPSWYQSLGVSLVVLCLFGAYLLFSRYHKK